MTVGGTSATSPSFAGMLTLLVEKYGKQGNFNQTLYSLAEQPDELCGDLPRHHDGQQRAALYHGIAGCVGGLVGYEATAGYDLVTGLGSINGGALYAALAPVGPGGHDYNSFGFTEFADDRRHDPAERDGELDDIRNHHWNGYVQGGQHDDWNGPGFWRHSDIEQRDGECGKRIQRWLGFDHGKLQRRCELWSLKQFHDADGGTGTDKCDGHGDPELGDHQRHYYTDRLGDLRDGRNHYRNGDIQGGRHDPGHDDACQWHGDAQQCECKHGERIQCQLDSDHGELQRGSQFCVSQRQHCADGSAGGDLHPQCQPTRGYREFQRHTDAKLNKLRRDGFVCDQRQLDQWHAVERFRERAFGHPNQWWKWKLRADNHCKRGRREPRPCGSVDERLCGGTWGDTARRAVYGLPEAGAGCPADGSCYLAGRILNGLRRRWNR